MDWLKGILVLNAVGIAVSMATAAVLAWQNAGSRNLALAVGALVAACSLFVLQLVFELRRPEPVAETFSADLTIDGLDHKIRQWRYTNNYAAAALVHNADRVIYDDPAGPTVAKENPKVFDGDRQRRPQPVCLLPCGA